MSGVFSQALTRATTVVEIEILVQCPPSYGHRVVTVEINLFAFHGFPEPFDEDVAAPAALAVHADLNVVLFEYADEGRTGELTALVRVHDFRRTKFQNSLLQRLDTRIGRYPTRSSPS